MKKRINIRKILCIFCVIFIFTINNSFIYKTEPTTSEKEGADAIATEEIAFTLDDVMNSEYTAVDDSETDVVDEIDIRSFDKDDWNLVLVNKQHSIPEDYELTLGVLKTSKGSMKCDERIIPELQQMMQAAKADGVTLEIRSPYRDYERQIYLFSRKIKSYMKNKLSYLESYRKTAQVVTVPGSSEHQIGLALDITSDTYTTLTEGFADTQAGKWLAMHSYEYGFILRYPSGKEDITGIAFEPWHFRYVGKSAAKYMYDHDITLEEFTAELLEQQ